MFNKKDGLEKKSTSVFITVSETLQKALIKPLELMELIR